MTPISAFDRAQAAWNRLASLRASRRLLKEFTYGDQWKWPVTDQDGKLTTEGDAVRSMGKTPLTNNLLRSLVKSVVGRFRHLISSDNAASDPNQLDELDARTLEEFLISGCAIQRVTVENRMGGPEVWVDRLSPACFFVNSFSDPRGSDIETIGMLHEMDCERMIMMFGHGLRHNAKSCPCPLSDCG